MHYYTVPNLVADHFIVSGQESARRQSECAFTMQVSLKDDRLCVSLLICPLMLGKRTCLHVLDETAIGFCTPHKRVHIHTEARFMVSADLQRITQYIPSIQRVETHT